MCYVIITPGSLSWFIISLITTMLLITATFSPKWIIGAELYTEREYNITIHRSPSMGINTRCTVMSSPMRYQCGNIDLDGFSTDSSVYPTPWKFAMFFQALGTSVMAMTVLCTLLTFCRQSLMGKGIHSCTGPAQVFAGISVMIAIFCHMLGWGAPRVHRLCGPDAEPFYLAECKIGWALYSAIAGVCLSFVCAGVGRKAESASMSTHVKRRIEGGERLVFVA